MADGSERTSATRGWSLPTRASASRASAGAGPAVLLLACLAPGCSTEYLPVALTPDGALVVVSEDEPGTGCEALGPVEARHGTLCNAMGRTGTRNGAVSVLRNSAGARGANYVRVERELPPDVGQDNCLFTLRGTAFRCPDAAP